MAINTVMGYDDDQVVFPGGSPSTGETITFTSPSDHTIQISDGDSTLVDGTDDRDDEDGDQIATVHDEFGALETSRQVQPRERFELENNGDTFIAHRIYIASSNSYYYIFEDPPPEIGVEYTVTVVSTPNSTAYTSFSTTGIACFTSGIRVMTPRGPRAAGLIRPGDLVDTLDHGPQPVRWVGRQAVSRPEMRPHPGLTPFRVSAETFGRASRRATWWSRASTGFCSRANVSKRNSASPRCWQRSTRWRMAAACAARPRSSAPSMST